MSTTATRDTETIVHYTTLDRPTPVLLDGLEHAVYQSMDKCRTIGQVTEIDTEIKPDDMIAGNTEAEVLVELTFHRNPVDDLDEDDWVPYTQQVLENTVEAWVDNSGDRYY